MNLENPGHSIYMSEFYKKENQNCGRETWSWPHTSTTKFSRLW